ncbi:unnamed protein product [Boreogadus saida]
MFGPNSGDLHPTLKRERGNEEDRAPPIGALPHSVHQSSPFDGPECSPGLLLNFNLGSESDAEFGSVGGIGAFVSCSSDLLIPFVNQSDTICYLPSRAGRLSEFVPAATEHNETEM